MKHPARLTSTLLGLLLLGAAAQAARANDGIFPPAPAAAPYVNFDGRGFLLNGKRTFLASGGMEYCRVPRALWRDRLLRLKRAGFNTVEIYNMWNFHEPKPGQFDFAGDHDLDAFLKLVKAMDLYAIVRVGPYVCAEWDSGGYPVWLRFEPGVRVREDNPQFEAAVDRYWEKLIPIVAANQVNRGGAVILVQLENEHPSGWGTEMPNAYFTHLHDKAVALGLQVPYFFSGLHHGSDPAGDDPWSSQGRTSPWFTTEFWSIWYDHYGQKQADVDAYDRRMWKVLAYGGNGLNFYMLHGGTNFGYTNDDEDTSSYDYGAAIGQAGDLRPTYYRFKRAALFARSFQSVLEDSDNASDAYKSAATDAGIRVTARTAPAGTILFLDNNGKAPIKTQMKEADGTLFPVSGPLTVAPGQIVPVVKDYALLPGVTLERAANVLGVQTQGNVTTLVAYAPAGDSVEMRFRLASPATAMGNASILSPDRRTATLLSVAHDRPQVGSFRVGAQTVRVVAVSTALADRTWFVDDKVIIGPEFVGDVKAQGGRTSLTSESPTGLVTDALVFGADMAPGHLLPMGSNTSTPPAPALSAWQVRRGDAEAQTGYQDAPWKASADPLPMGADGDSSAYAWYRTTVNTPKAGMYSLQFAAAGDWLSVFVGGRPVVSGLAKRPVSLSLPVGISSMAILAAHYGRPKLFGALGPIGTVDVKGLAGPVVLAAGGGHSLAVVGWRVKNDNAPDKANPPADTAGAAWRDAKLGEDAFGRKRGFAWYRTTLPSLPGDHRRLHFEDVDDNATVYLNGKQVAAHEGYGTPFDAPLDTAWSAAGPNELAVLVQNTDGTGGINGTVSLETVAAGDETTVQGWKMRGGLDYPAADAHWDGSAGSQLEGAPAFYRTSFDAAPPAEIGPHPILRVTTTGLSRGFVWLNGHNLGRYPERIPVDGLYLPECWQKKGRNELVVFDEEGHSPAQVKIRVEQAASRVVVPMAEK